MPNPHWISFAIVPLPPGSAYSPDDQHCDQAHVCATATVRPMQAQLLRFVLWTVVGCRRKEYAHDPAPNGYVGCATTATVLETRADGFARANRIMGDSMRDVISAPTPASIWAGNTGI